MSKYLIPKKKKSNSNRKLLILLAAVLVVLAVLAFAVVRIFDSALPDTGDGTGDTGASGEQTTNPDGGASGEGSQSGESGDGGSTQQGTTDTPPPQPTRQKSSPRQTISSAATSMTRLSPCSAVLQASRLRTSSPRLRHSRQAWSSIPVRPTIYSSTALLSTPIWHLTTRVTPHRATTSG